MFTGLVQSMGTLLRREERSVWVAVEPGSWPDPILIGESVAVNGCCLTVAEMTPVALRFDLSEETISRTTLGSIAEGGRVNLERALRVGDRLGGHFVQGHVDGVGKLLSIQPLEGSWAFRFQNSPGADELLVEKGSVAIDGISLTVIDPGAGEFSVAVIPHTLMATNLGSMAPGDPVNLEFDMLAKHVQNLLRRG